MDPAFASGTTPKTVVFQDGLGERRRITDVSGAETIEQLCLRSDLTAIPSFEFALRERASRLGNFRHVYYARVRSVDRLTDPASTLTVVSDSIKGVRLANLLTASERRPLTLDINASLHLIRQLVAAVAMLHETARDVAHGCIGPERIIVTPSARVVIAEYVLGAALEQLRFSRERYWKDLRVALPGPSALQRFDHRADVTQIGVVALSLVIGRLLHDDEYPSGAGDVLALASAISAKGEHQTLPSSIRTWIGRALQLDPKHSFTTALEARDALDRVLSGEDDEDLAEITGSEDAMTDGSSAVSSSSISAVTIPEPSYAPLSVFKPQDSSSSVSVVKPVESSSSASAFKAPEFGLSRSLTTPSAPKTASFPEPPVFRPEPRPDDDEEQAAESPLSFMSRLPGGRVAAIAVAIVVLSTVGVFGARKYFMSATPAVPTGSLNINTDPPGATVVVDGQVSGITPLTLTLKAGGHNVELRGNGEPRTVPVTITAGTQVSQYIELPKAMTAFGQLQIRTEPAGALVTVDGIARGKSPVLVESLAAGEHAVALEGDHSNVKQTVTIEAGVTASLVVPMGAAADSAPVSGWVSVSAPVELQLYENKRLLGSSQSDRVMVSAGRHEIELVNETVGYRSVRTVQVAPGKTAALKVEWPKGTIAINALPWADVWIDGERIGETPIGNLSLPIGPHEILFRHPELGEQKYAATVTLSAPARVSVDLRKK